MLSDKTGGLRGNYREPSPELSFANFIASLTARAMAYSNVRTQKTS